MLGLTSSAMLCLRRPLRAGEWEVNAASQLSCALLSDFCSSLVRARHVGAANVSIRNVSGAVGWVVGARVAMH